MSEEQPPVEQLPLEQPTMEQPPVAPPVAPTPPPPKKKRGKWVVLFLLIIVVIVIIAEASNLPSPTPPAGDSGDGTQLSWQALTTLSGLGDKTTDTFTVTGSKFRLTWSATADAECIALFAPDDCPAVFGFFVYPDGETVLFVESVSNINFNSATDETIVFRSGSFYVQVVAANLASWGIEVHEWR